MTDPAVSPSEASARPEWWRPVWICLAGEQPLPNVLPLLAHLPETVVFFHTDLKASFEAAKRCAKFMEARGVVVRTVPTSASEPAKVAEDVLAEAVKHDFSRVLLNYTGGTKPMSLAAYNAVPPHVPRIYFDLRNGIMLNQTRFEPLALPTLGVEDMLALHADVTVELTGIVPPPSEASSDLLSRWIKENPSYLGQMMSYRQKHLQKFHNKHGWSNLPGPLPIPFQDKHPERAQELELAMRADGILEPRDGFFPSNPGGLNYLHGLWWEQVVARRIMEGFKQHGIDGSTVNLRTNLNIRWAKETASAPNELDIAFVFRNRLYLVSCTTATESETEKRRIQVEAFADRLGGHFAKAMLACTLDGATLDKLKARSGDSIKIPSRTLLQKPADLVRWLCLSS